MRQPRSIERRKEILRGECASPDAFLPEFPVVVAARGKQKKLKFLQAEKKSIPTFFIREKMPRFETRQNLI